MSALTLRLSHSPRRVTAATEESWPRPVAALVWSAVSAVLWTGIISMGAALF